MWNQKCVIWVFFGKNFKYTIVKFEMSRLEFVYLQNLSKKLKFLNLVIFEIEFENNIVIFEISTVEFFLIAKYRGKTKMLKFGTRNALFLYFCGRILKQYHLI